MIPLPECIDSSSGNSDNESEIALAADSENEDPYDPVRRPPRSLETLLVGNEDNEPKKK